MLYYILFAVIAVVILVIELRVSKRNELKERKAFAAMLRNRKVKYLPWPARKTK